MVPRFKYLHLKLILNCYSLYCMTFEVYLCCDVDFCVENI